MREPLQPTPYVDINVALHGFLASIQAILGNRFCGMYLIGSLALGDFDPHSSDIDFVVVTEDVLSDDLFVALQAMYARLGESSSSWAAKVEAVYITRDALRRSVPSSEQCPQVEKGTSLFKDRLESGWIFQCYTLREHGIVMAGPAPNMLIDPIDPDDMRRAVAAIPEMWQNQARHDPSWLVWLRQKGNQAFVVLTLCRLLYTLDSGTVTSKPAAARWAERATGRRWADLIKRSRAWQHENGDISQSNINETVAFIQYTVDCYQQWNQSQQKS